MDWGFVLYDNGHCGLSLQDPIRTDGGCAAGLAALLADCGRTVHVLRDEVGVSAKPRNHAGLVLGLLY